MSSQSAIMTMPSPPPEATWYLIELRTGEGKRFGIKVEDGKLVADGDMAPEGAAKQFFDYFMLSVGEEFKKLAAQRFNGP